MSLEIAMQTILAIVCCCSTLVCCAPKEAPGEASPHELDVGGDEPLRALPEQVRFDVARAALGEALFSEPALSGDAKVACADCHHVEHGLADDRAHSRVPDRPESALNSPTMYNVSLLDKLTWVGKFNSLDSHLDALIQNPKLMSSSWQRASERLARVSNYGERFRAVFSDGLTPANVRDAVLEYERSLLTPNAPIDRYLRGNASSISELALRGYGMFKSYGCSSCHQGMMIGGNVFQAFGVMGDFFGDRGHIVEADFGRFNVTGRERDRFVFRVPSLRNVAHTAPYFHDGSAATLSEAVTLMARYQLGRELNHDECSALVAFLETLSGEYRGHPL